MAKILIIDDELPTLNMFRLFLSAYGHEVVTAETGEKGVEMFVAERPDIVLSDIKMPGMDGLKVLELIKKVDPAAEVIMVTGHGDMDLAIQALNLDATDFINKPIQRQMLDQALKRAQERLARAGKEGNEISLRRDGDKAVIVIRGLLTEKSDPYLQEAFGQAVKAGAARIVLEFASSVSISGGGIPLLKEEISKARDAGIEVAVTGLAANFRSVFEVVGLSKLVNLQED